MGMSGNHIQPLIERIRAIFLGNPMGEPTPEVSQLINTIRQEGYSDEVIVAMIWNREYGTKKISRLGDNLEWNALNAMVERTRLSSQPM